MRAPSVSASQHSARSFGSSVWGSTASGRASGLKFKSGDNVEVNYSSKGR